jgi:hypothetical protein
VGWLDVVSDGMRATGSSASVHNKVDRVWLRAMVDAIRFMGYTQRLSENFGWVFLFIVFLTFRDVLFNANH